MNALLEVESLRKSYGDRVVLHDVDLTVETGDVVCLIGSSGSGKSTLLRCLNLLEEIDDGVIRFEGREISDPRVDKRDVRRRIGIVFQAYNLFPHLSVLDNVTLAPRKVHGVGRGEAEARARELLDRFGLARARHQPPRSTLRRPAAAGRPGARARHQAGAAAPRRDHRRTRPRADRRRARRRPRPGRRGHDDGAGHPRDGLRARRGQHGVLPREGRDPRARAPGADLHRPARAEDAASSCGGCCRRDHEAPSLRPRSRDRSAARRQGRRARRHRARPARLHDPGRPRRRRRARRPGGRCGAVDGRPRRDEPRPARASRPT